MTDTVTVYTVVPPDAATHVMSSGADSLHHLLWLKLEGHRERRDHCLVRVFASDPGPTGEKFSHAYYCCDGRVELWPDVTIPATLLAKVTISERSRA